jgi:antitoxin MazE
MGTAIRTRIVKIGNSQGIRIPKLLLEQSGIQAEVEIEVQGNHLTIRTAPCLRAGWDEDFASMSQKQDWAESQNEVLLDEFDPTNWEQSEWDW